MSSFVELPAFFNSSSNAEEGGICSTVLYDYMLG